MKRLAALTAAFAGVASCTGSTGGEIFEFEAYAAGPERPDARAPYAFTTGRGYAVSLIEARLHVGALYLNESVPTSVASETSCTLPGIYVAEVPGGLDVNLLDPAPAAFGVSGVATSDRARTAEVWLSSGDIDAEADPVVVAFVAGTATRGAESYPFDGTITIGPNRAVPPSDPAQPGAKPICKQRVVTPIAVDITPEAGGALLVRIDPAAWFGNVEFAELEKVSDAPLLYRFRDDSEDQPSRNLYAGVRANGGVYRFDWLEEAP